MWWLATLALSAAHAWWAAPDVEGWMVLWAFVAYPVVALPISLVARIFGAFPFGLGLFWTTVALIFVTYIPVN